ncbi:unnamed protein product [Paramecium primaurelia]|uniref:Uncharacterized protein n=1 Tax=Paramecium primaurelia TaxID=5886 RepID=A0A8S1NFI3_PARPR|nr:unnamed protein product [Paramecium primaurelia]
MNDKIIVTICFIYFQMNSSVYSKQKYKFHSDKQFCTITLQQQEYKLSNLNRERNSKNITKQKVQKLNRISTIHIGIIEIVSFKEIIIDWEKILRIQCMIGVMRRFQFPKCRQNNKQNER